MRVGVCSAAALGACAVLVYSACGSNSSSNTPDGGEPESGATRDSGTTDAATNDSGANLPAGVLTDPSIWSAVPGRGPCPLFTANVSADPFPARTWAACGTGGWATGCTVSSAGLPIDGFTTGATGQTSAAVIDGQIYLQSVMGFGFTNVAQVVRLSDQRTLAAARIEEGSCLFAGFPRDTPLLITPMLDDGDGGLTQSFGVGSLDAGPIVWDTHWFPTIGYVDDTFLFDLGHGYTYIGGDIEAVASSGASTFTPIRSGTGTNVSTSARGDLMVWGDATATGGEVVAYTTAHGTQTLTTNTQGAEAKFPFLVSLSDDHIAWLVVTETALDTFDSAQVLWSPRATQASEVTVTSGPMLPHPAPILNGFALGGDYIAATSCDNVASTDPPSCFVNVVQMSTQKVWSIPQRPGSNWFIKTLAIDSQELVLAESNGPFDNFVRRLVRIETSQLDALAVH